MKAIYTERTLLAKSHVPKGFPCEHLFSAGALPLVANAHMCRLSLMSSMFAFVKS